MPQVSSHQPGNFCWFELGTSDWKAAKEFYTALFGWKANELPMDENSPPYVMLQKGGKDVGALYYMPETEQGSRCSAGAQRPVAITPNGGSA